MLYTTPIVAQLMVRNQGVICAKTAVFRYYFRTVTYSYAQNKAPSN